MNVIDSYITICMRNRLAKITPGGMGRFGILNVDRSKRKIVKLVLDGEVIATCCAMFETVGLLRKQILYIFGKETDDDTPRSIYTR